MELEPWSDGLQLMEKPYSIEGTWATEVIAEIAPQPQDYVIPKHRWSSFAGTHLDILLRGLGIDTILLAGGSTDVGIISTAYAARDLGYHLIILRDACQSQRPGAQDFCMNRLFPRMARSRTWSRPSGSSGQPPESGFMNAPGPRTRSATWLRPLLDAGRGQDFGWKTMEVSQWQKSW